MKEEIVQLGTGGLFKMFGHEHDIQAKGLGAGSSGIPRRPRFPRFVLEIDAASLTVADEELSVKDRAQVQSDMETKTLALPQNPRIVFESTEVRVEEAEGASRRLKVRGTLGSPGPHQGRRGSADSRTRRGRLTAKGEMEA
jgi:hypothetical protein